MPNHLTARKLNGPAKHLICQLFAEFESPTAIQTAVENEFGVRVSRETLYHYKNHPRWQKVIEEKRQALDANVDRLPISSRFWRLRKRQELIGKAEALMQKSGDVAAPGTLLTDAARELGQLKPEATATHIGNINIEAIQKVLALPADALREYLQTGRLAPESYLSDVQRVNDIPLPDPPDVE